MLEDLEGAVEVTAWSQVYTATQDLWQEGNILLVRGKVRSRGDRVTVVCDSVEQYIPGAGSEYGISPRRRVKRNHRQIQRTKWRPQTNGN